MAGSIWGAYGTTPVQNGGGGSSSGPKKDPLVKQLEEMTSATFDPGLVNSLNSAVKLGRAAGQDDKSLLQSLISITGAGESVLSSIKGVLGGDSGTTTVGDAQPNGGGLDVQALLAGANKPKAFSLNDLTGMGLDAAQAQDAFLEQFGLGSKSQAAAAAAQTNASANWLQAQTQAAAQKATEFYQNGLLSLQGGQLDLAKQQFAAAEYWNKVSSQFTAANAGTNIANAESTNIGTRGGLELGAANTFSGLASLLGNLATTQATLGTQLLTNPRNSVAAFLLGQGADPANAAQFGNFNVSRLLGIDPAQIQDMIARAATGAGAAQTRAAAPATVDLKGLLDMISGAAKSGQQGSGQPGGGASGSAGGGSTGGGATTPASTPETNNMTRVPSTAPITVDPAVYQRVLGGGFPALANEDVLPWGSTPALLNPTPAPTMWGGFPALANEDAGTGAQPVNPQDWGNSVATYLMDLFNSTYGATGGNSTWE